MTYRLAIDYGTSYSGAAIADPATGEARTVFVNGRPTIPSLVVLDARSGELLTGDTAENAASIRPDTVVRAPKRHLGRPEPLFREPRIGPEDAVAATLRVLVAEASMINDREPASEVRLTHPARWAASRRDALREAASRAGIENPQLLPEPVAAAIRFAAGERIKPGDLVAVYDLGAGTFDTAVLERTDDGFVLHGEPGGLETGGDSFDERLYAYLGRQIEAADWDALQNSTERTWQRAQADFRRWIRLAKEALSSNPRGVDVQYPGPADRDPLWLTSDELNEQLRPDLEKTVDELERTMSAAGIDADRVSAVYLAGGSSKIPLVETLIVGRFGKSARLEDDRKQVVALGAAAAPASALREHDPRIAEREDLDATRRAAEAAALVERDRLAAQAEAAAQAERERIAAATAAANIGPPPAAEPGAPTAEVRAASDPVGQPRPTYWGQSAKEARQAPPAKPPAPPAGPSWAPSPSTSGATPSPPPGGDPPVAPPRPADPPPAAVAPPAAGPAWSIPPRDVSSSASPAPGPSIGLVSAAVGAGASVISLLIQLALGSFADWNPAPYFPAYAIVGGASGFGAARLVGSAWGIASVTGVGYALGLVVTDIVVTQAMGGAITEVPLEDSGFYWGPVLVGGLAAAVIWVLAARWYARRGGA